MAVLTIKAGNKDIKSKKKTFADNIVHNIVRLFDDWANFAFAKWSKSRLVAINCYIQITTGVAERFKTLGS